MKASILFKKNMYQVMVIVAFVLAASLMLWQIVNAITTTNISKTITNYKLTVSYTDVTGGTSVNPALYCGDTQFADVSGNSCKKVIVYSPAAAASIFSVATKVSTPFAISGMNTTINVTRIVVEDASGNQLSTADVALPSTLDQTLKENRRGNSLENMFYDESNAVNLVYYIFCRNSNTGVPTSCNSLSAGEFIVYSAITKP